MRAPFRSKDRLQMKVRTIKLQQPTPNLAATRHSPCLNL